MNRKGEEMKEFNFGGNKRFYLGGENNGGQITHHEIQIEREDFSKIMRNILSSDEIEEILRECDYEDALGYAWICIEWDNIYDEKFRNGEKLYKLIGIDDINELNEQAEKMEPFLERDEIIVRGYNILINIIQEYQEDLNKILEKELKKKEKIKPGFIYLIGAENGLCKIGKAQDINVRMKTFGQIIPMNWELLYSFRSNDYTKAENYLHKKYKDKRKIGEWFALSSEDVDYIMSIEDFSL